MHAATLDDDGEMVTYLIAAGADPRKKNRDGERAVDLAARGSPAHVHLREAMKRPKTPK